MARKKPIDPVKRTAPGGNLEAEGEQRDEINELSNDIVRRLGPLDKMDDSALDLRRETYQKLGELYGSLAELLDFELTKRKIELEGAA